MDKVVCLFEVASDGSTQWEMAEADGSRCIEYFHTKEDAEAYAKANSLEIVEWIMD